MEAKRPNKPRPTITVWFYDISKIGPSRVTEERDNWHAEPFLDDDTFDDAIRIVTEDYGCTYALWQRDLAWWLLKRVLGGTTTRNYPNREAAEMIAIHNG